MSIIRFEAHVESALCNAASLTGQYVSPPLKWVVLTSDIEDASDVTYQDSADGIQAEAVGIDTPEKDDGSTSDTAEEDDKPPLDEEASEIIVSDILQADDDEVNETSDIRYSENAMVFRPGRMVRTIVTFFSKLLLTHPSS